MKKVKMLIGLSCLSMILAACGDKDNQVATSAANESGELSGDLSFYTSQPDTDAQKLIDSFHEKHPDVNIKLFRSGTEEVVSKIMAENQAGEVQADVILLADNVTFESLDEEGILAEYESDEATSIDEKFIDEEKKYTGTKIMSTVLAVNSEKVKELPDSWGDLADAGKGEVIMPSPLYSGAAAYNVGVFNRQDGFGWEFFEQLKKNDVSVVQGNGAALKSLASGEVSYGLIVDYLVTNAKKEGSPVELVYPSEGVPVITEPIALTSNAKNEKAAKEFIDFVLSEEGQQIAQSLGYVPIRQGMDAPEGLQGVDQLKVLTAPTQELMETREAEKRQFKELFGE